MISLTQLPFRKAGTPRWQELREFTLPEDCILEQWIAPKGTAVILKTTENFGWCVLPEGTLDKRGFVIPRRIFRY